MRKGKSKNWCIEFHSSFLVVGLGFIFTGYYLNFIAFTTLVLIHEFGHYIVSRLLNIKVKKIVIYPFGGITKLDAMVNLDINSELLVATSGVIFQFIFYLIICYCYHLGIIREYTFHLFSYYHTQIILFNLLPIYPLDGGKILYLLMLYFLPYKVSNNSIIILSSIMIIALIFLQIYTMNYSNVMIYFLLIYFIVMFWKKRKYFYNKFLLERYLYSFNFNKVSILNNYQYMYKNRKHYIYDKGKYLEEKDFLKKFLHKIRNHN